MSAQQLDGVTDEVATDIMQIAEDQELELISLPTPAETQREEVDDDGTPVVSQQQLAQIFDIGPSYALPPLEDMFYQVAGLFSSKASEQTV
jgi:NET1-associated nuclear protein 1 (U3 small nucleolar RNA-associated protein 17)